MVKIVLFALLFPIALLVGCVAGGVLSQPPGCHYDGDGFYEGRDC